MSSISQCRSNLIKYKNLKVNLNSILSKISSAISDSDNVGNKIKNRYLINDESTPIVSRTIKLKNDMKSTYNYIKFKVLPAIDVAISNTNKEMKKLEKENG